MKGRIKIFIGSSNQGKIKEIQKIFSDYEIVPNPEIFEGLNIEENGSTFEENALIKAKSFYGVLKSIPDDLLVMSDDSGLHIEGLNGEPGIYSARYANLNNGICENATDIANIECVIQNLHKKSIRSSKVTFVAAIALVGKIRGKYVEKVVRGELEGKIIDSPRGENGFGYDPLFIPIGYERTLGELEEREKNQISHRKNALQNARIFLEQITRY